MISESTTPGLKHRCSRKGSVTSQVRVQYCIRWRVVRRSTFFSLISIYRSDLSYMFCVKSELDRIMNNSSCAGAQVQNSSSEDLQVIGKPLYSSLVVNIVFNCLLCYTTNMLNIITIHALRKTSSLSKPLKTLLLNLTVSDLGVGLLGQPLFIAFLVEKLRFIDARLTNYLAYNTVATLLCLSSFCSIMALSADRFIAIQMPLRYANIVSHKRVVTVVTVIWVFLVLFVPCMTISHSN